MMHIVEYQGQDMRCCIVLNARSKTLYVVVVTVVAIAVVGASVASGVGEGIVAVAVVVWLGAITMDAQPGVACVDVYRRFATLRLRTPALLPRKSPELGDVGDERLVGDL